VQIEFADTGDLKRLAKALRRHADGKALRKELTGELREVLRPIRDEVKAAYLARPGHVGPYTRTRAAQPPLRTLLAKATRLEVRTSGKLAGARVRVDGRKMPSGMRSLPAMYEGPPRGKRWRHPVHGPHGSDTWVGQRSRPTFGPTVQPSEADARRRIDAAVGGVFAQIERAT
jgi:hypothetical protein